MCGDVVVPEDVWGAGSALTVFGASVGGGVAAAEAVVAELPAAFLSDSGVSLVKEAAPVEVSFLSAGSRIRSESSGQEPLERGAGDPPA